jgi:predicted RNase H-like HicB family nuclease
LADRITGTGAVISRFWPSQPATRYTFPHRCVVSSGISQGTLVVEAPCPSIAQGQAREALEHGKQVFLLSRLVSSEAWASEYLKHGAVEVETAEDILNHMHSVAHIEEMAAAKEAKKRIRIPFYKEAPINWGATTPAGVSEPGWPNAVSSNQTPSSAWPSGSACEDETKGVGDGFAAGLQALNIEGSMYAYAEEDPAADTARGASGMFSFENSTASSPAGELIPEPEVELIFDPQLEGGYTVYAPELPGLVARGETLEQATASATEALTLYVKNMRDRGKPVRHSVVRRKFPLPPE